MSEVNRQYLPKLELSDYYLHEEHVAYFFMPSLSGRAAPTKGSTCKELCFYLASLMTIFTPLTNVESSSMLKNREAES